MTIGFIANIALAVNPSDEGMKKDLRNNKFSLLLKLVGFEQSLNGTWEIPAHISSADLKLALSKIGTGERGDTLQSYPDAKPAEKYLRRKPTTVSQDDDDLPALQSDSEGEESFDETVLFPVGGPTARKPDAPKPLKRRLKRKRDVIELDDDEKTKRADARHKRDDEKKRKIKSDLFIHDSDDESDDERDAAFFAKEAERRKLAGSSIANALEAARKEESRKRKSTTNEEGSKKRRAVPSDDSDAESHSDSDEETAKPKEVIDISSDHSSSDSEDEEEETPISSQPKAPSYVAADPDGNKENTPQQRGSNDVVMSDASDDESPVKRPVRRNLRAGFVIDDSDSD